MSYLLGQVELYIKSNTKSYKQQRKATKSDIKSNGKLLKASKI